MSRTRLYPDERAGAFPSPPVTFTDGDGREVTIRPFEPGDREALVTMYEAFDPADRAQGIPPTQPKRIHSWLDDILEPGCENVLAWHDGRVVGHATLVPDGDEHELAIFVLQAYQSAGIGTQLLETLLGHGRDEGVDRVWLTVERWNGSAIALYRKVGFETSNAESFELEMSILL